MGITRCHGGMINIGEPLDGGFKDPRIQGVKGAKG
jgi:hypothetical protein